MVAAGGIAALIVAAIVTWNIFQHSAPASALGSTAPPGTIAQASGNSGSGQRGSSPAPGSHHASAGPSAGGTSDPHNSNQATPKGGPKTAPSGKPSGTPTTSGGSPGSPGPSSSATPTPTPSPSTTSPSTGVTLPAGYIWHKFPAAQMGAVAGFKIGMPVLWTQSVSAPVAHMNQTVRSFHLSVDLSYWLYSKPLREAQYLQSQAAAAHKGHGYKELLLSSTNFSSLGGFRSATAAELKYSWNNASLGYNQTELIILVTLSTSAGPQSYEFELWAQTQTFGSARSVLTTALPTFRPLPG